MDWPCVIWAVWKVMVWSWICFLHPAPCQVVAVPHLCSLLVGSVRRPDVTAGAVTHLLGSWSLFSHLFLFGPGVITSQSWKKTRTKQHGTIWCNISLLLLEIFHEVLCSQSKHETHLFMCVAKFVEVLWMALSLVPPLGSVCLGRPYQGLLPKATQLPGSQGHTNPFNTVRWRFAGGSGGHCGGSCQEKNTLWEIFKVVLT